MRFSLLLLAAALVGCGGSTSPDTDGGSTPMTDGGSTPMTDGGSGPMTDGGSNPMTDGGSMPATDGGSMPTTDAGNPGGPGVMCGTMTCSDPQVCCTTFAMGAVTMTCTDSSMCMGATVSCDGPEDCSGGQICCGTFSQQANAYTTLKCQSTCGGQWEREICKPNGTCTTSGQTCSQSSFLTSYIWRCN